jgi:general secretion pathway protein B
LTVSFILDALRKSEHERQRSAAPGLAQVPLATPQAQLPRWAVVVIGALGAGVLVLGGAWWQSTRTAREPAEPPARVVERNIELPAPAAVVPPAPAPAPRATPRPEAPAPSLAMAAGSAPAREPAAPEAASPAVSAPARLELPADGAALPSAAALAAEGVPLPTLRLELHAFSREPRDRFVFINGRKYVEGDRLAEGPQLVTIAPTGAVLVHAGRRFMLVQE